MTAPKLPTRLRCCWPECHYEWDTPLTAHDYELCPRCYSSFTINKPYTLRAAMRAATAGSGAASAASAGSAAHVAPPVGGEPVAWAARMPSETNPKDWAVFDNLAEAQEHVDFFRDSLLVPLFTRPAPPVSASFDAALAGLDVENDYAPDRGTTYAIVGIDDVRAAHRAEVDALRDAIALVRVNIAHERGCSHLLCIPTCAHAILDAAIRARGVAKPRTDGEAATGSGEGAKS